MGSYVRQRLVGAAVELIVERGWTGSARGGGRAGRGGPRARALPLRVAACPAGRGCGWRDAGIVQELAPLLERVRTPGDAVDLVLGSLDRYTRRDPVSLLFSETYLTATRHEDLRQAVGTVVTDFHQELARWLGEHGVEAPQETATVLAAAIDGVMLHRALNPGMTLSSIAPVLRRILAPTVIAHSPDSKGR
jgi:Tetracyclin repressor-like, C-terminal domain